MNETPKANGATKKKPSAWRRLIAEVTDDEIRATIPTVHSMRSAARALGINDTGSSMIRFAERVGRLQLDTAHFSLAPKQTPNAVKLETPNNVLFSKRNIKVAPSHLLIRIVRDNLRSHECEECHLKPTWNGKPLTLRIVHMNGDPLDQRLENLKIFCPNCHAQLPPSLIGGYLKRKQSLIEKRERERYEELLKENQPVE